MPNGCGRCHNQSVVALLIAVVSLGLLVLFLVWAFGTGSEPRTTPAPPPADDGLLIRIATLSRRESALALRAVLSDAGIRSTLRCPGPTGATVLVFPEDAPRARALAVTFPGGD